MEENKVLEEWGRQTNKKKQQMLDFKSVISPSEFTRAGVLHAVAALIATNNQVSFIPYRQCDSLTQSAPVASHPC